MCARFVHMHRLCSSMLRQGNGSLRAKKGLECLDQRIRERSGDGRAGTAGERLRPALLSRLEFPLGQLQLALHNGRPGKRRNAMTLGKCVAIRAAIGFNCPLSCRIA